MDFQPLADSMNTEKVNRQREQMFKKHLEEINKKYRALYDPVHTQIVPFNELDSRQQIPFDKSITNHVYAVIFNPDKLMYIWADGQKIKAFDLYMKKGEGPKGNAYFLGY